MWYAFRGNENDNIPTRQDYENWRLKEGRIEVILCNIFLSLKQPKNGISQSGA